MPPNQQKFGRMIQAGLNLMSQAVSVHDSDLRLVHGNRRFQTMFQLPDRLMQPGTEFQDVLRYATDHGEYGPVDDPDSFVAEKVALARRFEPHYFERTRANGTAISVEGAPLDGGGWITVYTDITDVKRQERLFRSHAKDLSDELLRRSEELEQTNRALNASVRALETTQQDLKKSRERLDLINRMTPAHIAHVDADGIYTHSNGRLSSIVPLSENNIIGRSFKEALGGDIWDQIAPRFDMVLQGDDSVSEFRDDASGRFVRLAMSPDTDDDGKVQGAYILSTDVTEETLARLALTHARRKELVAQLTSVISHDFSNLLTIIMGQQDKLQQAAGTDPKLLTISETIKNAARRGRDLIGTLNEIDAQRQIEPTAIEWSSFIEGFEHLAQAALPDGMTFSLHNSLTDRRIMLDPGFAQDALLNLVLNASEACEGTGAVTVVMERTGENDLAMRVTDTGPGFTEEARENALNPFFSTKGGKGGRGLGLTSAFDFAKSCGGTLRIRNAPAGGAIVSIRIPYLPVTDTTDTLVLLVDDDDDLRKTVRSYLRQAGYRVIEATSPQEAAPLMKIDGLSCVITDLDLGEGRSGLDVVAATPAPVPRMIMTGLPATDPHRQKAEQVCDVLAKPFDYDRLHMALLRLTSKPVNH